MSVVLASNVMVTLANELISLQEQVGCFYHTVVTRLHADKLKRELLEPHCGIETDCIKQPMTCISATGILTHCQSL